ncbi:hypothetical protein [Paenibacillus xylanexedens]|uniref:hypothetical protein n=1 Tax=Paenibacillus xylanexedens TaxID=528191 RepID=UPI0011A863B5|nr:hypothetical protein [Paenibacillus xylanexedens]
MVTVETTLQDRDGIIKVSSGKKIYLNEAQVTALLNSDIVTYPEDGGNGYTTSVKTKLIEKHFSLFDAEPKWELTFQLIE